MLTTVIAFLSMFFTLVSCKKDDASQKSEIHKPTCRILTATPNSGDADNFTYNFEGKLKSISSGTRLTTLAYSGNTIVAYTTYSGTFGSKKIISLNNDGLVSNMRTENDATGTSWNNQVFEYSGTELIKSTTTSSGGGTLSVSAYTWSGGNLATIMSGSSIITLEYSDKPAQAGDYFQLIQSIQGYEYIRTKNLLKSVTSGTNITDIDYTFDTDGKILSLNMTGASANSYNYQYQCN